MGFKDNSVENKLLEISSEIKQKRDSSEVNSEAKKYYRALSKNLDRTIVRKGKGNES